MKKFIFSILILVSTFTVEAEARKFNANSVISMVKTYDTEPGFEIVSVGKIGIGLTRFVTNLSAEIEEDKAAMALLKGINKIVIVDYEEASESRRNAFNTELNRLLDKAEKIIEVKDDEDTVYIYGRSLKGGKSIDDLIIFMPEDYSLICILGSISAKNIANLIEMTND